jgi:hypothetical protein
METETESHTDLIASSDNDPSKVQSLERSIEALQERVKALTDLVLILWRTKGPSGNFRLYFRKELFPDKSDLEVYIKERIPDANVIPAVEDGKLAGYAFFTCDDPLDAPKLGKVEWSHSGQHDVIMRNDV